MGGFNWRFPGDVRDKKIEDKVSAVRFRGRDAC